MKKIKLQLQRVTRLKLRQSRNHGYLILNKEPEILEALEDVGNITEGDDGPILWSNETLCDYGQTVTKELEFNTNSRGTYLNVVNKARLAAIEQLDELEEADELEVMRLASLKRLMNRHGFEDQDAMDIIKAKAVSTFTGTVSSTIKKRSGAGGGAGDTPVENQPETQNKQEPPVNNTPELPEEGAKGGAGNKHESKTEKAGS